MYLMQALFLMYGLSSSYSSFVLKFLILMKISTTLFLLVIFTLDLGADFVERVFDIKKSPQKTIGSSRSLGLRSR